MEEFDNQCSRAWVVKRPSHSDACGPLPRSTVNVRYMPRIAFAGPRPSGHQRKAIWDNRLVAASLVVRLCVGDRRVCCPQLVRKIFTSGQRRSPVTITFPQVRALWPF
jgi:hypothetical protein